MTDTLTIRLPDGGHATMPASYAWLNLHTGEVRVGPPTALNKAASNELAMIKTLPCYPAARAAVLGKGQVEAELKRTTDAAMSAVETAAEMVRQREAAVAAREEQQRAAWLERNRELERRADALASDRAAVTAALQEADNRVHAANEAAAAAIAERDGLLRFVRAAGEGAAA
ncbi:MAG: hypothetical protein AB7S71_18215 [Dongiaceae bacterium]